MTKHHSGDDFKDVTAPGHQLRLPVSAGRQSLDFVNHGNVRSLNRGLGFQDPRLASEQDGSRADATYSRSTFSEIQTHHRVDSGLPANDTESSNLGPRSNYATNEYPLDFDNCFDDCFDADFRIPGQMTHNGVGLAASWSSLATHTGMASYLAEQGLGEPANIDHTTSPYSRGSEHRYISPGNGQYSRSFEQHYAQSPYFSLAPNTQAQPHAFDDGSPHPRLSWNDDWRYPRPTAFTPTDQAARLLSSSVATYTGPSDMPWNPSLVRGSGLSSSSARPGQHPEDTTADFPIFNPYVNPFSPSEPAQAAPLLETPNSPVRTSRVTGEKHICKEGNCRRGVKHPGSFCKRHQDKYDRNHAKPPQIPFLQMSFDRVRQMAFPSYPQILPGGPDPTLPLAGTECDRENRWVAAFLRAAMKAVDKSKPGITKFEKEQQEKFNGKARMEGREGGRYSDEWINARMRMLFRTVLALHCGGPAIYPIGGDNGGYGKPDTSLNFEQRLNVLYTSMEENKLIVMNVIEGRGVVALAENPERFHKRKTQNKQSNQKKDEVLEAERKRQRSTVEHDDELSEDEEEELDGADEEAHELRAISAARPNLTSHAKRHASIDMPDKLEVRRSKRIKPETLEASTSQVLGGLPQAASGSSQAMFSPRTEHMGAQFWPAEGGPSSVSEYQNDPHDFRQPSIAQPYNEHLDTSSLHHNTVDFEHTSKEDEPTMVSQYLDDDMFADEHI